MKYLLVEMSRTVGQAITIQYFGSFASLDEAVAARLAVESEAQSPTLKFRILAVLE